MQHDHKCHCGTGKPSPHEISEGGCVRKMVDAPVAVGDKWLVDGSVISDYSLRDQRGYYQHPCGCWSSWPGSVNSVDG